MALIRTLISVIIVVLLTGCGNAGIRSTLAKMYKSHLSLPSDMITVCDGHVSAFSGTDSTRPLMLVYYDSAECGSCRISQLGLLDTLFSLSESSGAFDLLVLFSPALDETVSVVSQLVERRYVSPVSVDVSGSFPALNSFIPDDSNFHYILTDTERHPIFVGDPLRSVGLWEMFIERLGIEK